MKRISNISSTEFSLSILKEMSRIPQNINIAITNIFCTYWFRNIQRHLYVRYDK
jgi:hypothetical protein